MSLNGLLKLLSLLFRALLALRSLISKHMRRIITADNVSIGIKYLHDDKEEGNIRYNMAEGYFTIFSWPDSFSALVKAKELFRLLSFAVKIIKSERC